jgi:hypothetical protein
MMRRVLALLLCIGLAAPGCATAQRPRYATRPQQVPVAAAADRDVLADYAAQLPLGAKVRATVADHQTIRGTLVKRTDRALVIQPRARVAEPLIEVPYDKLVALEQETPTGGVGRAVAIGVGVGVGAAVGLLFLLAAVLSD